MLIYTNDLWKLYGDLENVKKVMEEIDGRWQNCRRFY